MRCDAKWAVLIAGTGIASFALGACAPVDPGFGEALRYDMAIQTVDPDPVYDEDGAKPGDSGTHNAKAAERYRKDQTKAIRRETISSGGGGSGGSGGSSSGSSSGPQ